MTEHAPGDPAPASGAYEQINIFGQPTGIRVDMVRGRPLPPASIGLFWRQIDPDPKFNRARQQRRPVDTYVGARLKQLRVASGRSISEVSLEIGAFEQSLAAYERGEERPSPSEILKLVKLFGADLREIFPESSDRIIGKLH